jgi:DNA-binding beta-propeller fold protein YncE
MKLPIKPQFVLCFAAAIAAAQSNGIVSSGPVLGHVFDKAAHSLRPIRGIPGAAMLADPVDFGFPLEDAVISSEQGFALGITNKRSSVKLIRWTNGVSTSDLPVAGTVSALYLSPLGTAAAVSTDGWIGFITAITSNTPRVDGFALDSAPVTAAVSDDGAYLLAVFADGAATMLGRDGTRTSLQSPVVIKRVAFRPGSTDALAASDNQVFLIQQTASSAVFLTIASGADGISDPMGLGFLPDGNRAVIADASGTIQTIDLRNGQRSSIACGCKPVQLERMALPGAFRLTETLHEPQFLFDGVAGRSFFVPAALVGTAGGRRPRD